MTDAQARAINAPRFIVASINRILSSDGSAARHHEVRSARAGIHQPCAPLPSVVWQADRRGGRARHRNGDVQVRAVLVLAVHPEPQRAELLLFPRTRL